MKGDVDRVEAEPVGQSPKSGHWIAAEGMQFPWRWNGGTISVNLGVNLGKVG
jgi:hypothetical protein